MGGIVCGAGVACCSVSFSPGLDVVVRIAALPRSKTAKCDSIPVGEWAGDALCLGRTKCVSQRGGACEKTKSKKNEGQAPVVG